MDPPEEIIDEADLMICPEEHTRCYVPEPDEACPAFDKTDGSRPTEEEQEADLKARAEVIGDSTHGVLECAWLEVGGACADEEGERVCCYLLRFPGPDRGGCGRPFMIAQHAQRADALRRDDWV